MFNRSFKARIDGFDARIRRQKGNNADQQYLRCHLLFELDADIAGEIGGPAPRVFALMANGADDGSVGPIPITLNSRAVNVRFRVANKYHVISETISLSLKAIPPSSANVSPMLQVTVSFLAGPNDLSMLWDQMGRQVGIRMDRQQLELPGVGSAPAPNDEQQEQQEVVQ